MSEIKALRSATLGTLNLLDHDRHFIERGTLNMTRGNARYMFPASVAGNRIRAVVRAENPVEIHSITPYYEVFSLR